MNERDLSLIVRHVHRERAALPGAGALREQLRVMDLDGLPARRRWGRPLIPGGSQPLLRATTYVVAAVIVGLFGGLLLVGMWTQPNDQQSPSVGASASADADVHASPAPDAVDTLEDARLLPGVELVTEEVEPGVLRIVSDGVRELTFPLAVTDGCRGYCFSDHRLEVTPDGGVRIIGPEVAFRLGDETHSDPAALSPRGVVDSEGAVWDIVQRSPHGAGDLITVKDGERDLKARDVEQYAIHPDGALFMVRETQDDPNRFGLIGPVFKDDWRDKAEVRSRLGIRAGGTGPLLVDPTSGGEGRVYTGALARADAGWEGWELSRNGKGSTFPLSDAGKVIEFAYGPDGTSWRLVRTEHMAGSERGPSPTVKNFLTRVSPGGGPSGVSYPVPIKYEGDHPFSILAVTRDGSVWLGRPWWTEPEERYGGLLHFDGQDWTSYLVGHLVIGVEIAPGGTAWIQTADVEPPDVDPDSGSVEDVYDKDGRVLTFAIPDEPR